MMQPHTQRTLGSLLLLIGIVAVFLMPQLASAQQIFPPITPQCDQQLETVNGFQSIAKENRCDLNDFVQLFINLFDWGLAILSILSVVFFIIGGAYLLLSAGNEQRVTTGKAILVNTAIGIGITLSSWLIVNTLIGVLTGSTNYGEVKVFGQNWWGSGSICSSTTECSQYETTRGCADISTQYVSELQRKLRTAGCGTIEADGCFGSQTETALIAFNRIHEILPENFATEKTWTALNSGKTCAQGATVQEIASGTGCCIPMCGVGISNTEKENGSNGCMDLYPDALYIPGVACPTESNSVAKEGCCLRVATNTCIPSTNRVWCTQKYITGEEIKIPNAPGNYFSEQPCLGANHVQGCTDANTEELCQ